MVTSHFTHYAKNTVRCSREHMVFMPLPAPYDTWTCEPLPNTIAIRRRGRHRALDAYWLIESEQLIQGRRKSDPGFPRLLNSSCSCSGSSSSPFGRRHGSLPPRSCRLSSHHV